MKVLHRTTICRANLQRRHRRFFSSFLFPITRIKILLLSVSILVVVRILFFINLFDNTNTTKTKILRNKQHNVYRGKQYWKDGVTQDVTTLYETPFARFQIHKVKIDNLDGKKPKVIDDWMWFDESDNINVLVETLEGKYLVLQQTKYGIDGLTYAVVGGLIEPNEKPIDAAKRELHEELGMTATEWIDLGQYRAAANRGGGVTYTYLARKATSYSTTSNNNKQQNPNDEAGGGGGGMVHVAEGELERQDVISLSRSQLIEYVLDGKFKEIKWTATVSLALLRTTTSTTTNADEN